MGKRSGSQNMDERWAKDAIFFAGTLDFLSLGSHFANHISLYLCVLNFSIYYIQIHPRPHDRIIQDEHWARPWNLRDFVWRAWTLRESPPEKRRRNNSVARRTRHGGSHPRPDRILTNQARPQPARYKWHSRPKSILNDADWKSWWRAFTRCGGWRTYTQPKNAGAAPSVRCADIEICPWQESLAAHTLESNPARVQSKTSPHKHWDPWDVEHQHTRSRQQPQVVWSYYTPSVDVWHPRCIASEVTYLTAARASPSRYTP